MNPEYDELLVLAETLGEVKSKTEKLETEFSTQARPLEAATNALSAALSGIKALQFHVLDNNLGQLSARVEEMRKAVDEQVGVIALELKKADETNAEKAGQEAEALRSEIAALQAQLGTLGAQFAAQLERVEFSAKEEAKKLQLIPGPAGAAGASLNPRGTFIDGETYNRLDVVSWLGSSYIAAVDGVTEKPSKNSNQWQVLASRGSGGAGGAGDFGSLAGVAQINQGGTGQTTRAAGLNALLPSQTGNVQYMLLTDGAGTVSWGAQPVAGLPSQTSNGGKLLTTDGTNASWSSTLTGSLVVNGTLTSGSTLSTSAGLSCQNADITGGYITLRGFGTQDGGLIFLGQSANNNYINSSASAISTAIANTAVVRAQAEGWRVLTTTASTSTSSGALVVGNGTSGGLGVGGAINAGVGTHSFGTSAGGGVNNFGSLLTYFNIRSTSDSDNPIFRVYDGRVNVSAFEVNARTQIVTLPGTTASTSTSSGALVVSGGVGVAKRIHSGEGLTTGGDNETHISFVRNGTVSIGPTSSAAPKLSISSAVVLAAATQSLAAWGDIGAQFAVSGSVLTDTQSSGTVSRCVLNSFASTNVAAAGATTFTQAATLFVAGGPTAGTNVTITNAYAIYTAGGRINFQGLPTSSAGLQAGTLWNDSGTLKVA